MVEVNLEVEGDQSLTSSKRHIVCRIFERGQTLQATIHDVAKLLRFYASLSGQLRGLHVIPVARFCEIRRFLIVPTVLRVLQLCTKASFRHISAIQSHVTMTLPIFCNVIGLVLFVEQLPVILTTRALP